MVNIPQNLTLTIALTLLTLLLSTVFNTVQEFGTAVYRIAGYCSYHYQGSYMLPGGWSLSVFLHVCLLAAACKNY